MACLGLEYASAHDIADRPADWWRAVLGIVGFASRPLEYPGVPVTASMTPPLPGSPALCEVWRVDRAAENDAAAAQIHGRVSYRVHGGYLFGAVMLSEAEWGPGATALQCATAAAYADIFAVLEATQYAHLIRIWNYLPDINGYADGEERYRHFNAARQAAFRAAGRRIVGSVPAACALGAPTASPMSIYFVASSRAPTLIENPRQTSAYHYPRKFGDHSPTFSRACVLEECGGTNLFISGTASIIGSDSVHVGDVAAQTRETLVNIDALVDEANRVVGAHTYALERLRLKVYVRRPADLKIIERIVSASVGPELPALYLHADICREELLVEIEATGDRLH